MTYNMQAMEQDLNSNQRLLRAVDKLMEPTAGGLICVMLHHRTIGSVTDYFTDQQENTVMFRYLYKTRLMNIQTQF